MFFFLSATFVWLFPPGLQKSHGVPFKDVRKRMRQFELNKTDPERLLRIRMISSEYDFFGLPDLDPIPDPGQNPTFKLR